MLSRFRVLTLVTLVLLTPMSLLAEGKKTPENPSAILALGGGAVLAWKYIRARLRR